MHAFTGDADILEVMKRLANGDCWLGEERRIFIFGEIDSNVAYLSFIQVY